MFGQSEGRNKVYRDCDVMPSGRSYPLPVTGIAVWDWAPRGTPVRGCLVLGDESNRTRTQYDYGKGPVAVHTPATLARELEAETKLPPELDVRVAAAVRKLAPVSGWQAASTSPDPRPATGEPSLQPSNRLRRAR